MYDPGAEVRKRCIREMLDELVRLDHEPGESEVYLNRLMCATRDWARMIGVNDKRIKRENVKKFATAFLRAAGIRAGVLGNLPADLLQH